MALSPRLFTTILLACMSVCAVCRAQNKDKPPDAKLPSIDGEVKGTPVKRSPSRTDDDIALLAPRTAGDSAESVNMQTAGGPAGKESAGVPQDPEKRKAEIASLEQQIKEKQKKIELLMRMFVVDEEAFLKDPSGQSEEQEARAKRKYEQDELLREGKEIAQLRTRLAQITPAGEEKPASGGNTAVN